MTEHAPQQAPRTPNSSSAPAAYYPAFDWLRWVLAAVVMLYHDKVLSWPHSGSFAVSVFFALSGWLIGGILLNQTRADLPRFFFNRAIRIWIPYFLGFALLVSASMLRDSMTAKWWEFVAYKASFVYNLFGPPQLANFRNEMPLKGTGNHFWSVNAEEQFYLLAPLLLVLATKWWGLHVLTWVVLAAITWYTEYYAAIVFGVLAAVLAQRNGAWHTGPAARVALWGVVFVSGWVMATGAVAYQAVAPICSVAIVLALAVPGPSSRLGTLMGGMSYELYLNHWIGVFVANALLSPFDLRDTSWRRALAVVLNIALAAALYWWIDRRMLAKRRAWFTPQRGMAALVAGYVVVASGIAFGMSMLPYR